MPQIVNKKSVLEMAMGAIAEITDYEVERVVARRPEDRLSPYI